MTLRFLFEVPIALHSCVRMVGTCVALIVPIYIYIYMIYVNNYLYNLAYQESNEKNPSAENILNLIASKIKQRSFHKHYA